MKGKLGISILLLGFFALTRWPGLFPANFSAGYALMFCAGVFRRHIPVWVPWLGLVGTDIALNLFYYDTDPIAPFMMLNYAAFFALYMLGRGFSARTPLWRLAGGGMLGALIFYILTNTAAWIQSPEYAKTFQGWIQALTVGTAGWPQTWTFFRNTLISGGLFTFLFSALLKSLPEVEHESEEETESETETETKRDPKAESGASDGSEAGAGAATGEAV